MSPGFFLYLPCDAMKQDELELLCKPVHDRLQADDIDGAIALIMSMPLKVGCEVAQELGFNGAWLAESKPKLRKICDEQAPFHTKSANEKHERLMALNTLYLRIIHTIKCSELGQTLVDVAHILIMKHKLTPYELMTKLVDGDEQMLRERFELTKAELAKALAELVPGFGCYEQVKGRGEALLAETFEDFVKRMTPGFGFNVLKDRQKHQLNNQ